MKKLLLLICLLFIFCSGIPSSAQETRERMDRDIHRRNRMSLLNEDDVRQIINRTKEELEHERREREREMAGSVYPRNKGCQGKQCAIAPPARGIPAQPPANAECGKLGMKGSTGCHMTGRSGCPMMAKKAMACWFLSWMVMSFIMMIVHILVAIWVYQDIKKRNTGSGIWIIIALLTGLLGTAVYALVRIGDSKK